MLLLMGVAAEDLENCPVGFDPATASSWGAPGVLPPGFAFVDLTNIVLEPVLGATCTSPPCESGMCCCGSVVDTAMIRPGRDADATIISDGTTTNTTTGRDAGTAITSELELLADGSWKPTTRVNYINRPVDVSSPVIAPPAGGSVFEKLAGKDCRIEREGSSSLVCFGAATKRNDRHVHFDDEPVANVNNPEGKYVHDVARSGYLHRLEVREAARGHFCKFHRLELRDF